VTDDDTGRQPAATDLPEPVLEGLAAHATAAPTDPGAPPDDLAALDDRLGNAAVVGLGEASHGSREFFRAKHRLIRHLVREHDLGAVAFEANLPEARAIDAYVRGGDGDPVAALEGVYFWIWTVEAVLELLEWLRSYNAGRPPADQVRFYGLDAQYTAGAVASLRSFLEAVDPDALDAVAGDLALADDEGVPPHQDDRRRERAAAVDRLARALRERIAAREAAYTEQAGADRLERARRDLRVLEQAAAHRRAVEARASAADPRPEHTERVLRVRDRAMAENAGWVADRTDGPVAVWGHDAHLNRVAQRSRTADAAAPSMGADLAARYGDGYLAVGFSAERLGFQAMGPEGDGDGYTLRGFTVEGPLAGTTEAAVAAATDGPVVVDLRAGREDPRLREWLATPRDHLSVGATFEPGQPRAYTTAYAHGDAFDLLWHVPGTERARPAGDG